MAEISVVIPAYNVGAFVERALNSVINQTFRDIEVIIIDDGSTDNTPEICDSFAKSDARIKVIHQKNAGVSRARNRGIDISSGKYLYFLDPDDWAEINMLEVMYSLAEKHGAEYVCTGFYIDTYYRENEYMSIIKRAPDSYFSLSSEFRKSACKLFDENILYPPWNKLFLASRVKELNIRFRDTKWDDFPFNLDYMRDVSSVVIDHRAFYHFTRARAESETAMYMPAMFTKREEEHEWLKDLYAYWGLLDDEQSAEMLSRRYIERVFGVIANELSRKSSLSVREKFINIKTIISSPNMKPCLSLMKPKSFYVKIMVIPLKLHSAILTYCLGLTINFVKNRNLRLFSWLKARR